MNWQIGKARCRSDEYEAEIVGRHGDHLIGVAWNKAAPNEWYTHRWEPDGTSLSSSSLDLLPPRLSLEEASGEARDARRAESLALDLRVERAKNVRLLAILVGISALECPPDVTVSGITYRFAPKDPTRMLDAYRELSERIREIPAAIDTALEASGEARDARSYHELMAFEPCDLKDFGGCGPVHLCQPCESRQKLKAARQQEDAKS